MKDKDITEKILEDYNDVFADIVNVLLFKGERKILEEELENTSVHSQYKDSEGLLHEEERDVSKFWKRCRIRIAMFGIENQSQPDSRMPIRIFGYEGASYRAQLHEKQLYPVITLVLYFGTDRHWGRKRNLKNIVEVPDFLDDYVNDFKINVFEIAWLSEEVVNKFTSDFRVVANFFVEKRKNKDYIPNDRTTIKHVDEVLKLLSVMTNDNKYEKILYSGGDEVHNMCEVAERLVNKGKEELIIQMLKSGVSAERIAEVCALNLEYVKDLEVHLVHS